MTTQLIGIAILLIWVYLMVLTKWAASVQARGKDIEKQLAAQQSAICVCGHKWSAHNENGCCWDEKCECKSYAAQAPCSCGGERQLLTRCVKCQRLDEVK